MNALTLIRCMSSELNSLKQEHINKEISNPKEPIRSEGHLFLEQSVTAAHISAKGNIIVGGNCEGCQIKSDLGSVFVQYGSSHQANIQAQKNIFVKHCVASHLQAGEEIVIESSALDSQLQAKVIRTESPKSKIIGGELKAQDLIQSDIIGNIQQRKTILKLEDKKGSIKVGRIFPNVHIQIESSHMTIEKENTKAIYRLSYGKIESTSQPD